MASKLVTHIVADDTKSLVTRAYTDIPAGQMHYRCQGKGETLLLLHMALSSSDEYTRLIPLLSGDYRVLAPDHLGYGESDMPAHELTIEEYAENVVSFIDSLGVDRCHISGHHAGTLLAVEIATRYPERVSSLILSALPCRRDPAENLARLQLPEMQRVEISWDGSHLMDYWERANRFGESVQVCNERALDYFKAGPRGEEMHWAAFKYTVLPKWAEIKGPVLLMCGSKDWLLPGTAVAETVIPDCRTRIVEGGSTVMNREMPRDVAAPMLEFLRGLKP